MSIKISFHGAAGTVTGSKHLVELPDGQRILLDCGMFQGEGKDSDNKNRHFGFSPHSIDALILSHAHIDHSGLIPRFVAEGFKGTIYCTQATKDLCEIMLMDSARIQEADHYYDSRHSKDRESSDFANEPLYSVQDVLPALDRFQPIPYNKEVQVMPGVVLRFTDAGHILGSAVVNLRLDDVGIERRITFSGDVGRYVDRLLPEPARFPQADVIICESTYGDRDHAPVADAHAELLHHVVETCVKRKGKLIIPAFSVGKTQEILYTLNKLSNEHQLPRIPVYLDSPMAINATHVIRDHSELFREDVREELHRDPDLFNFPGSEYVMSSERSKSLNKRDDPCIVISASGMMEAGRIRHHLKHSLPDPRTTVLVVGFCAPGTLGSRLLDGAKEVKIFGEPIAVKAEIARMEFYSAHADRFELVRWLKCQDPKKVHKVFLVHGVDRALNGLKKVLSDEGFGQILIPEQGEVFEF